MKKVRLTPGFDVGQVVLWFGLIFFGAVFLLRDVPAGPDGRSYLSFERSFFVDGDLNLANESQILSRPFVLSPRHYAVDLRSIGAPILWIPFYGLARLNEGVLSPAKLLPTGNGLGSHYVVWLAFADWLLGGLSVLVMWQWYRTSVSARSALFGLIAVLFGTPFFYLMSHYAVSSHMASVFLATLFLQEWSRPLSAASWKRWAILGVLGGLSAVVASYNALLLFLPGIDFLRLVIRGKRQGRVIITTALSFGLALVLALGPQLLAWRLMFGAFFSPQGRQLRWLTPHVLESLLSPYHGLFFFAPVLFLTVGGLVTLWRQDKDRAISIVVLLVAWAYIAGANQAWWAGASVGARYYLTLTPLFGWLLAILALAASGWRQLWRFVLGGIALVCVVWSYLLFLQAFALFISTARYYPLAEQLILQGEALKQLPALLRAHWLTPKTDWTVAYLVPFAVVILLSIAWTVSGTLRRRLIPLSLTLVAMGWLFIGVTWRNDRPMALEPTRSVPLLRYDPLDLISNLAEEARYYRIKGQPEQMLAVVKEMFEVWPDKSRALMEVAGPTDSFRPVDLQFADERRLWGYHADMQGDLIVSLAWEKLASRGATVFPAVQALTPSRDVVGCGGACRPVSLYPMGYVPLPDAFLPAGVQYIDVYHLPLDSLPSGPTVRLRALLSDMQGNSQPSLKLDGSPGDGFVGFAKVQAPKPFHLSQIPVSAEVTFGDGIALRGYSLGLAEGGREAVLDLYWQSLATPQADYTIFVHLVDLSSNSIIAQQDNPPLQGTFPTGLWQAGDSLVDTYRLRLPEIVKPGTYQLRVGLYQPETGQRLTVIDSNRPVQDGAVLIAEVEY